MITVEEFREFITDSAVEDADALDKEIQQTVEDFTPHDPILAGKIRALGDCFLDLANYIKAKKET